jgi:hypothetical protein
MMARKPNRIGMVKNNRSTGVDDVHTDGILSFTPTKRFKCLRMINSTAIAVAFLDKDSHLVKNFKTYSKHDHDLSAFYSHGELGPEYYA